MVCDIELDVLLPQLGAVEVERVESGAGVLRIVARTRDGVEVGCPGCGRGSGWVHSRYVRHVEDEAVGGRPVVIDLSVRRLYCEGPDCPRTTFVEQVGGLTVRYQRRTPALQQVVDAVAVALAGSAGARLLAVMHHVLTWASVLNCLMRMDDPAPAALRVVAVDDFALRRSRRYATLLVDADSRLPVDVWDTRDVEPLTAWLRAHPGIEVVCRDGSVTYRSAITAGAPDAVQVSDRFHLWQGLGRKVYEVVAAHRPCLPEPATGTPATPVPGGLAAAPHAPSAHRGARAAGTGDGAARHRPPSRAGPQRGATLRPRADLAAGRADLAQAHRHHRPVPELPAPPLGRGAAQHRRPAPRDRRAGLLRQRLHLPPPAPERSPFEVSRLLMTRPQRLDDDQRVFLKSLHGRCPELKTVHERIGTFADVFASQNTKRLDNWISQVRRDGIPQLVSYTNGLLNDLDAVRAAVTLPHSSGVAEGRVTDLKMIKRQMAGRAKIPLLRKRVLLIAHSRRPCQWP
ncbi:ISL3 family transposase [Streptomyces antibioticus]|uniref:ISL3 family transposase n=1 Tax=Streptomyces antibioticus TaxID=1890 RepID=UPI0033D4A2C4